MINLKCNLCPRGCNIDRRIQIGYCGGTDKLKVARAALHMWEEPCISGTTGSGAVFFSGCQLKCVFCQNYSIADSSNGKEIDTDRLVSIFFELKEKGACNINLVTGDQYIPQLAESIRIAKGKGFDLPFVYNTGSYVKAETLKILEGLVDIYLPDYKYFESETAKKYSNASDYPQVALDAVKEMVRQQPVCEFDEDGMMRRGVIVRHLLLPGRLIEAKHIVKRLFEVFGNSIYISLMSQYTPVNGIEKRYPELAATVSRKSYNKLIDYAIELGVEQGYYQSGDVAKESFIPCFDCEGV